MRNNAELKKKVQVVVLAEDELLLMEFNQNIANNYSGFQNITGAVEEGEDFQEAALRELVEEAGFEAPVVDINLTYEFFDRWQKQCFEKVFLCKLEKKPAITLSEEHLFYKWLPISKVTESDFRFPSNYQAFVAACKFVGKK